MPARTGAKSGREVDMRSAPVRGDGQPPSDYQRPAADATARSAVEFLHRAGVALVEGRVPVVDLQRQQVERGGSEPAGGTNVALLRVGIPTAFVRPFRR